MCRCVSSMISKMRYCSSQRNQSSEIHCAKYSSGKGDPPSKKQKNTKEDKLEKRQGEVFLAKSKVSWKHETQRLLLYTVFGGTRPKENEGDIVFLEKGTSLSGKIKPKGPYIFVGEGDPPTARPSSPPKGSPRPRRPLNAVFHIYTYIYVFNVHLYLPIFHIFSAGVAVASSPSPSFSSCYVFCTLTCNVSCIRLFRFGTSFLYVSIYPPCFMYPPFRFGISFLRVIISSYVTCVVCFLFSVLHLFLFS